MMLYSQFGAYRHAERQSLACEVNQLSFFHNRDAAMVEGVAAESTGMDALHAAGAPRSVHKSISENASRVALSFGSDSLKLCGIGSLDQALCQISSGQGRKFRDLELRRLPRHRQVIDDSIDKLHVERPAPI